MIRQLWRRRESPPVLSRRWFIVWVKRVLTAPALCALRLRQFHLRLRGARVGAMAIVEPCCVEGQPKLLSIGTGAFIGRGTELAVHADIHIGDHAVINRDVTILTASHSLRDADWGMYSKPVAIGERAWVATGAMILPGVTIGPGAVVGAGAVVRGDVPAGALAIGNPARLTLDARAAELRYDTARFAAPLEAWLGPQSLRPSSTTCGADR